MVISQNPQIVCIKNQRFPPSTLVGVFKVGIVDNEAKSAEGHDKNWKSGEKVKKVNARTLNLPNQYFVVDYFDLLQQ